MPPLSKKTQRLIAAVTAAANTDAPVAEPTPPAKEISQRQARVLQAQGQFLIHTVESLCTRLGGEKVAAGLLNLQAAAVFADQELAKIEAGLKQIAASVPPEES